MYGNYYNFTYSGTLDFKAGNWWLDANASNDPTWIDAGTVNTQLISEGGFLSLSYFYHGAHVYAVWERMD